MSRPPSPTSSIAPRSRAARSTSSSRARRAASSPPTTWASSTCSAGSGDATDRSGDLGWRELLRSDMKTYLETLAEEPAFAASLHVEALHAGPAALARRAEIFAIFTERTRRVYELAREEDARRPELPLEVFRIHTGGIDDVIRDFLRERPPEELPELADALTAGDTGIVRPLMADASTSASIPPTSTRTRSRTIRPSTSRCTSTSSTRRRGSAGSSGSATARTRATPR